MLCKLAKKGAIKSDLFDTQERKTKDREERQEKLNTSYSSVLVNSTAVLN